MPIILRLAVILFALTLSGCGGSSDSALNDKLRKQNDELQREVDKVTRQLRLREQELSTLRGAEQSPIAGADIPILMKLGFGRFSGGADTNNNDVDDTLRVYLSTLDQKDRFIVVAGEAVLQAVLINPGKPPATVVEKRFTAAEFDKAYRSGITGTHYTLEVPLPDKLTAEMASITVKITVIDATTGRSVSEEKVLKVKTGM